MARADARNLLIPERSRRACTRSAALFVAISLCFSARAEDGGTAPCAIDVELSGLRDGGLVWVMLFSDAQAKAFPRKRQEAFKRIDVVPSRGTARVSFDELECRTWAVAVVHDENGNGKLDRNFLGIPTEATAASRNARRLFGPPTFDDAKVRLRPGRTALPITVTY